jgi:hypothetical protein
MIVSEVETRKLFFERAARFAKFALATVAVLLFLMVVSGVLKRWAFNEMVRGGLIDFWRGDSEHRWGALKYALDLIDIFLTRDVASVLLVCPVAIVVLLLVDAAATGCKSRVFVPLDETFARRAGVLALGIRIYAWFYLVASVLSTGVETLREILSGARAYNGAGVPPIVRKLSFGSNALSVVTSTIAYFCLLMLMSYVIQALVTLSRGSESEEMPVAEEVRGE